ncbi:MAG: nuclear transport factor 2 family protein [Candidatus Bipolaricaulota bacterium]
MDVRPVDKVREAEMLELIERYERAANSGDGAAFEEILALDDPQFSEFEDFIPEPIGAATVRDILTWRREHPEFKYEVSYVQRRAFPLSDSLAYATALSTWRGDAGAGKGRVTWIAKRIDGRWRILHGHWSAMPEPERQ